MKKTREVELISVAAAAIEKGLSRQAVSLAIKENRLAATKYGSYYLIRRSDLNAWTPSPRGPKRKKKTGADPPPQSIQASPPRRLTAASFSHG